MTAPRQLGLFDRRPRVRHNAPATSKNEAARRERSDELRGQSRAIVLFLLAHGPHTRREMSRALKIDISSICPAVDRLKRRAWLVESDVERGHGNLLDIHALKRELARQVAQQ